MIRRAGLNTALKRSMHTPAGDRNRVVNAFECSRIGNISVHLTMTTTATAAAATETTKPTLYCQVFHTRCSQIIIICALEIRNSLSKSVRSW
jgi:hypothetical protein